MLYITSLNFVSTPEISTIRKAEQQLIREGDKQRDI